MTKGCVHTAATLLFAAVLATTARGQSFGSPETVEVHNGPITLPRRFHIKNFGLGHFPWLASEVHRLPSHDNGDGTSIYSFAPSEWGFPWHIRHAGVDAVFFLDPNHGGRSRIQEIPRHRMMQLAVPQLRLLDRANREWIAPLCRYFDRAFCGRLVLGSLDSAADLLLSKLGELPAAG